VTQSVDTPPAELVRVAIERLSAGDDEGFVASFAPEATVWAAPRVVLAGSEQIAGCCRAARSRWSDIGVPTAG
jgi:hypothetical protein